MYIITRSKYPKRISLDVETGITTLEEVQTVSIAPHVEYLAVTFSVAVLAEIYRLGHPENYLFVLLKKSYIGSEYPKKESIKI